jgi:lysophospholipase L1-like esterase
MKGADWVVLSVGGNDALQHIDLLETIAETTTKDLLVRLWKIREEFRQIDASLLDRLAATRAQVLVMTIYNPCFRGHGSDDAYQQAAASAVSIFNDVIQQEAHLRSFHILELRNLFGDSADYANQIEPSAIGGAKLAAALSAWIERCRAP